MQPPAGPDAHGVWMEGRLRKRPPQGKHLPGKSLQRRHCVLRTNALLYYGEQKDGSGGGSSGHHRDGSGGGGSSLSPTLLPVDGRDRAKSGDGGDEEKGEVKGRIPLVAVVGVRLSRTADGPQLEISVDTRVFYFVAMDDGQVCDLPGSPAPLMRMCPRPCPCPPLLCPSHSFHDHPSPSPFSFLP